MHAFSSPSASSPGAPGVDNDHADSEDAECWSQSSLTVPASPFSAVENAPSANNNETCSGHELPMCSAHPLESNDSVGCAYHSMAISDPVAAFVGPSHPSTA